MYDTIIIGAGIAGLTAALYASRKRMRYEILATQFGGEFMTSGEVENYPGIKKTTGVEFARIMEEQMKFNNVNVKIETVKEIKKEKGNFRVISDKGEYETQSVIIATGARARRLGVPGEKEFDKRGVTYCSICDGPLFSGKDVAVIGSGNSALEAVDFMKDIAKKIYLVVRSDKLKAHEYLIERIEKLDNVEVLYKAQTKEILGEVFVTGIKITQDDKERILDVNGVIVEIGRVPNTERFKNLVELDNEGHIKIDCTTHTSVKGIFAAGDCTSAQEYQYVIAAGQGCMALIKAAKYLASKKKD